MKKLIGVITAIAAVVGMGAQAAAPANGSNKDTIITARQQSAIVAYKNSFGGFSSTEKFGYKNIVCNQRQYRKWMRQTPQMRKSKKYRGK